jgi:prevent-host-death family protein
MKFVSVRELRNQTGALQRTVSEHDVTLTSNGRPFALMIGLGDDDDPAELARLVGQARAQWAVSRIRGEARRTGADRLGPGEIDEEIHAARVERRR